MYHVPLAVQCVHGWSNEESENVDGEDGSFLRRKWRLPSFLYADDLILCNESEEDKKFCRGI